MKHLTKFIEYLKENKKELDLDLIVNDFLVPIKHLGVKIDTYKSVITSGEFAGYSETTISFNFEQFDRVDGKTNTYIKDNRIWEFLDELIMFKSVMDEKYGNSISIWLSANRISINIYSKIEENDEFLIKKLNNEFRKHYSKKIHFVLDKKNGIEVYIEGTKRVWDNYIIENRIDLSKYNLEFTDNPTEITVRKAYSPSVRKKVTHLDILITVKK